MPECLENLKDAATAIIESYRLDDLRIPWRHNIRTKRFPKDCFRVTVYVTVGTKEEIQRRTEENY